MLHPPLIPPFTPLAPCLLIPHAERDSVARCRYNLLGLEFDVRSERCEHFSSNAGRSAEKTSKQCTSN